MSEELTGGHPEIKDSDTSGEGKGTVKVQVKFTLERATKA